MTDQISDAMWARLWGDVHGVEVKWSNAGLDARGHMWRHYDAETNTHPPVPPMDATSVEVLAIQVLDTWRPRNLGDKWLVSFRIPNNDYEQKVYADTPTAALAAAMCAAKGIEVDG